MLLGKTRRSKKGSAISLEKEGGKKRQPTSAARKEEEKTPSGYTITAKRPPAGILRVETLPVVTRKKKKKSAISRSTALKSVLSISDEERKV